jgi:hypothetical protein
MGRKSSGSSTSATTGARLHHLRARGRDSGAQLEVAEQNLWTLAGGKVIRYEWFHDRQQALEAAGIEE